MFAQELERLQRIITKNGFTIADTALKLATVLHAKQKRSGGQPYLVHLVKVALAVWSLGAKCEKALVVALLHDALEDTEITEADLREAGIPDDMIRTIRLLTKSKGHTDADDPAYYEAIRLDPIALLVKIADRQHNLSTMHQGFKPQKMASYVRETIAHVLPLCEYGFAHYAEYEDAIFMIKYHIQALCRTIRAFTNELTQEERTACLS